MTTPANPYRVNSEPEPTEASRLHELLEVGRIRRHARIVKYATNVVDRLCKHFSRIALRGRSSEMVWPMQWKRWWWDLDVAERLDVELLCGAVVLELKKRGFSPKRQEQTFGYTVEF